ncbi:putative mitochondrial hypothetical protein [Leptomonas pyrrhocoris]|uniref:Uncharacterized protein n=1 Tax=Leptomonas pyrrhocoris TaxID=157538 RepID=A0A0N0E031_LEPPY|nr:putative mitochondrial hypothetical protein [Leptomonas pyrrhocoris]KPA85972.1 putative mitochondrial hypothetical protein [Leptomonas pyrrhocoris]|eukprot:XP_015664411.1 putative mitochondrial hypothetical protein [Leptomonas pyrrhocoris]
MFSCTQSLLRRRGHGHVLKFLEGVPTPSKLIDHLAGADLHASAELQFFNTVPRYVDTQREHRMSKLFFHHVLYPAGGARLPYQAVVVRGGRAVRTSAPRLWRKTNAGAKGRTEKGEGKEQRRQSSSSPLPRPRQDPLAVPASQLGSSAPFGAPPTQLKLNSNRSAAATATTAVIEEVPSSSAWVRVDPARRPYFFSQASPSAGNPNRFRNTHADTGPTATNRYLPLSRTGVHDTVPAARAVEDDVLTPLRGVLEHYWNDNAEGTAPTQSSLAAARLQLLLAPSFGGLLWMSEKSGGGGGNPVASDSAIDNSTPSSSSVWERLIESLQQSLQQQQHQQPSSEGRTASTFTYVQTRLPPVATVALPMEHHRPRSEPLRSEEEDDGPSFLCRMAGGVEPVVPFAVGRLLAAPSASSSTPSDVLFSHISCLTRVNLKVSWSGPSAASAATAAEAVPSPHHSRGEQRNETVDASVKAPLSQAAAEPWKLGDDGLDLMVPQHVRTVAEHHPTKSLQRDAPSSSTTTAGATHGAVKGDRYVLGRADAETYLLPQRELLLTLYVPVRTEDMCAAQNDERLRRQVHAGRASRSAAMAWPTDQTRLTSSRRALGQFANAESAARTGTSQSSHLPSTLLSSSAKQDPAAPAAALTSRTSYEVRALPGDVVYVPRGWGYDVQRIVGTATVHNGLHKALRGSEASYAFSDHRALGGSPGSFTRTRPTHSTSSPLSRATQGGEVEGEKETSVTASAEVSSIAIDAFCLSYHPYPELTAAQAAVYVAANYVHAGVEEFYEQGGNRVHRSYE